MQYSNNYLCHHGTKGQRWGIRRFQNHDGTRTPLGKIRRRELEGYSGKSSKSTKIVKKEKVSKPKPKSTVERVKEMTDQEIDARFNRLTKEKNLIELEQKMSAFSKPKMSAGRKFVNKLVNEAIVPAAVDAGKTLAKEWLTQTGRDMLGLKAPNPESKKKKEN